MGTCSYVLTGTQQVRPPDIISCTPSHLPHVLQLISDLCVGPPIWIGHGRDLRVHLSRRRPRMCECMLPSPTLVLGVAEVPKASRPPPL